MKDHMFGLGGRCPQPAGFIAFGQNGQEGLSVCTPSHGGSLEGRARQPRLAWGVGSS
jgi:hypothetical protein